MKDLGRTAGAKEKRVVESWSPNIGSMSTLVPPDPDFIALKRRLKRSRDNIRRSRSDFFSSPSPAVTRTPTPNELCAIRRERISDTLWEHQPHQIDRLSVPSICVTNNSGSPMSHSDREDEMEELSSSSQSLRYFSEDEGVELRRPSSQNLFALPVTRSQSFQDQATFSNIQADPVSFSGKRVLSDDVLAAQRRTVAAINHRPPQGTLDGSAELHTRPHMVTRLIAKMRRATLDWRRANKSRRGELTSFVYFYNLCIIRHGHY